MRRSTHKSNGDALDTADLPSLPPGWCWTTLDTIAAIEGGVTKDQKRQRTNTTREVPYLRVANVQRGFLDLDEIKTILAEDNEIESLLLRKGDILFTEGGDRDKLGRGWIWNDEIPECIHQNHIFRARPSSSEISSKFISYHGNFFGQAWFTKTGKQTTNLASINMGILRRFPVPVAPANEQRRIVEKIDELFSDLDVGVAALKRAKANLKRYRAAVLKAAVDGSLTAEWRVKHPNVEPASKLLEWILIERRRKWESDQLAKFKVAGREPPTNWRDKYVEPSPPDTTNLPELPEGWCWATIRQLAFVDVGFAFKSGEYTKEGIRLLRGENMEPGSLRWQDVRYWSKGKLAGFEHLLINEGEIILAMDRPLISSGLKLARVKASDLPCLLVQRMARFRMIAPSVTEFLHASMQTQSFINHLLGDQTGTQLPHISGSGIEAFVTPLPPTAEQPELAAELARQTSVITECSRELFANLHRAARLRQSLLKQAFEGRLVPQDPRDEPAGVLLDRIKSESKPYEANGQPAKTKPRKKTKQKAT